MKHLRIHVLKFHLYKFVRTNNTQNLRDQAVYTRNYDFNVNMKRFYNSFSLKYMILNIKNLETKLKVTNK